MPKLAIRRVKDGSLVEAQDLLDGGGGTCPIKAHNHDEDDE